MANQYLGQVDEEETAVVQISTFDARQQAVAPLSLQYRIDDLTNRQEVLTWTPVSAPLTVNEITITADQNAILSNRNKIERRQMVIEATDSTGPRKKVVEWNVRNLQGVS